MKSVLVTGISFPHRLPVYAATRHAAWRVGASLAADGFGLVTGNTPGVDSVAAAAFCAELKRGGGSPQERYRQLWLPHFKRGFWLPSRAFEPPASCLVQLQEFDDWIEEAITRAAAAVMIGGRSGALEIARRFMDAGRPVFPLPFAGGQAQLVFQEILRTWADAPVPGLTRSQFLQLALPWTSGTGALTNLLLGTLADAPDIFISYRRSDTGMAAGRLHADLVEHFGRERVFMDLEDIEPSDPWNPSIERAVAASKVGIVLIGPRWTAGEDGRNRLLEDNDVLRGEVRSLLGAGKTVMPVLVAGAALPELPDDLQGLLRAQATALDNVNWPTAVGTMIRKIEHVLSAATAGPGPSPVVDGIAATG